MKKFYLVDYDHNKTAKKQERLYVVAAKIAIKYGSFGRRFKNCDELYIQEFWNSNDSPSFEYFLKHINVSTVKWYIHNKIDLEDKVWNGDFLHGITTVGEISWNRYRFPSLTWRSNETVFNLLKESGFGGDLKHPIYKKDKHVYRWIRVPAFYLKYDEGSLSFMAGVLASGDFCEKDGLTYVRYSMKTKRLLEKWSIPIEEVEEDGKSCLASPIWGALFVSKMPEGIRDAWLNIQRPYGRDIYPPILWRTYIDNKFPRGGIPYLKSRRWIFNHYKSEKGAMKTLERERVSRNLTQIDKRVREMVHAWNKNQDKSLI